MLGRYRRTLRASVAASAAPYGYTLTVWSCGAMAIEEGGLPGLVEALLFVAGGVLAFFLVETLAYGSPTASLRPGTGTEVALWGHAHLLSAGLAVASAAGVLWLAEGLLGWPLVAFVATLIYLLAGAAQVTAATAMSRAATD
jgi:hypothetical protein